MAREISEERIKVYSSNERKETGFWKSLLKIGQNIIFSRQLIIRLFLRDFLVGYKKSFLGATWVVISPFLGSAVWVFMNVAGVINPGKTGIPYPAYLLLGMTLWGLFLSFYQSSSATLTAGQSFILQVNYPHEVMLAKQALEQISNFAISLLVNLVILGFFHIFPSWKIIFLPLAVMPIFFLGAGIGLIISVLGVVAEVAKKLADYSFSLILFLTPVIYSGRSDNHLLQLVSDWNPLSYLLGGVRDLIVYGRISSIEQYVISSLGALSLFLLSLRFFYLTENYVIEKIL